MCNATGKIITYVTDNKSQQNVMPFDAMQYDQVLWTYATSERTELENAWLEIMASGMQRALW